MKPLPLLSMLLSIVAVCAAIDARAEQETDEGGSPPEATASCLIRVTFEPLHLPLTHRLLDEIVNSSGVLNDALDEVFGDDRPRPRVVVGFTAAGGHEDLQRHVAGHILQGENPRLRTVIGRLQVQVQPDTSHELPERAADKLLAALAQRLERELAAAGDLDRARVLNSLEVAQQDLAAAQRRLEEIQAEGQALRAAAGLSELSRDDVSTTLKRLEVQEREMLADLAAERARRTAIVEQVAAITSEIEQAVQSSKVLVELEKAVRLREQQLQRLQSLVESGHAAQTDLAEPQERVAMLQVQIADRREAAAGTSGGELLKNLKQELIRRSVDAAETEARLGQVQSMIAEMKDKNLLELADRYDSDVALRLPQAQAALKDAEWEVTRAQREARQFTLPTVTILGGLDTK